jgi:molecular chaperone HscB
MAASIPDPFATLGLPRRFDLARREIEAAYLSRAGASHPDVGGTAGIDDLNRARQTLADPEARADVLLRLLGGPSREDYRGLPPGFLAEILEVRGELELARASGDAGAVERWQEWAEAQRRSHIEAAGAEFSLIDREGATPARLAALRERLNAWRYIERMLEQVEGG